MFTWWTQLSRHLEFYIGNSTSEEVHYQDNLSSFDYFYRSEVYLICLWSCSDSGPPGTGLVRKSSSDSGTTLLTGSSTPTEFCLPNFDKQPIPWDPRDLVCMYLPSKIITILVESQWIILIIQWICKRICQLKEVYLKRLIIPFKCKDLFSFSSKIVKVYNCSSD